MVSPGVENGLVLTLVLAESAIELVPRLIWNHPSVVASARKKHREPARLILDQTYHHAAIRKLGNDRQGRGRPDIAHFSLLLALGWPLNLEGHLKCYVHTVDDRVITVDSGTRLPRNTDRFLGLLEQLYEEGAVPSKDEPLLTLHNWTLSQLLKEVGSDYVVALSTEGKQAKMEDLVREMVEHEKPTVLVGGFPKGHFSKRTLDLADAVYRIYRRELEAWTVVSRVVYDYERLLGLE